MSRGLNFFILLVGVTILDVIIFSPGLLGLQLIGESSFQTAVGAAVLTASALCLSFGVYKFFFKSFEPNPLKEIKTEDDYVASLIKFKEIKVLKSDILFTLEQIDRIKKKKEILLTVLNGRFEKSELSYHKFISVIFEIEKLFYLNIRNIINKVSIFDESEYKSITERDTSRFSTQILQEKIKLYNEYIDFLKNAININEEIILNLDKLLMEISRLDNFDNIENMSAMIEIETLIQQTKYYKR